MASDEDEEAQRAINELDIDLFVVENDLSETAALDLRDAPAAIQRAVLDQGPLEGMRDKSVGLLARLHRAQGNFGDVEAVGSRDSGADEVEEFIVEHMLSDEAADALRSCTPVVQRLVIDRGSLHSCRDASNACLGRIRDAQSGKFSPQGPVAMISGSQLAEVETFVAANGLTEGAAQALRTAAPHIQRIVLDQGSLEGCRDRSSACFGRISKAQRMAPSAPLLGSGPAVSVHAPSIEEVDNFIIENQLNDRASDVLRGVPGSVQRLVMEKGSLLTCRDPSAGCLGRIKLAQCGQMSGDPAVLVPSSAAFHSAVAATIVPPSSARMLPTEAEEQEEEEREDADIESFIFDNDIVGRAAEALRSESRKVQKYVIGMGPLDPSEEKSASCLERIGKFYRVTNQFAGKPRGPSTVSPEIEGILSRIADVESFVSANRLSGASLAVFRAAPPALQRAVIDRGSLLDSPNPNGALLERMREVKSGMPTDMRPVPTVSKAKEEQFDDNRPECGDFKRNVCARGKACRYKHVLPGQVSSVAGPVVVKRLLQGDAEASASKVGSVAGPVVVKRLLQGDAEVSARKVIRPTVDPARLLKPTVTDVKAVTGPRQPTGPPPRGQEGKEGEVRFDSALAARRAAEDLNGSLLGGRRLEVSLDPSDRQGQRVKVRGMGADADKQDLNDHFARCGRILFVGLTVPSLPATSSSPVLPPPSSAPSLPGGTITGEVRYEGRLETANAQSLLNGRIYPGGGPVAVIFDGTSKDGTKLLVKGLPASTDKPALRDFCSQVGRVAFIGFTGGPPTAAQQPQPPVIKPTTSTVGPGMAAIQQARAVQQQQRAFAPMAGAPVGVPPPPSHAPPFGHGNAGVPVGQPPPPSYAPPPGHGGGPAPLVGGLNGPQQLPLMFGPKPGLGGAAVGSVSGDLIGSIRFESPQEATRALVMDGQPFGGAVLSVAVDYVNSSSRVIVTGLPAGTRTQELQSMFARFGRVLATDCIARLTSRDSEWF